MKNAPCARFGMRIRPKIREKPEDSMNSRPPKATLFSVWMIQNCHCIDGPLFPTERVQKSWEPVCDRSPFSLKAHCCSLARAFRFLVPCGKVREGAEASPASEPAPSLGV